MAKTIEIVHAGWRFTWSGGSFINARRVETPTTTMPEEMISLPEWVNMSKLDAEGVLAVTMLWVWATATERIRVYDEEDEPHDIVARTKSGRILTEADILTLTDEAAHVDSSGSD